MKYSTLILVLLSFLTACGQKAEPEIYLIPKGYVGEINILFNQKNGLSPIYENGKRIYKIPPNGILLTQFDINDGYINRNYYYLDKNGKRLPLQVFKSINKDGKTKWENADKNEIGIFFDGTSGTYGSLGEDIPYQFFVVSDLNNIDSFFTEKYKLTFSQKLIQTVGYDFLNENIGK